MIYNIYEYDYEASDFKGDFLGIAHDRMPYEEGEGVPVEFDDEDWLNQGGS